MSIYRLQRIEIQRQAPAFKVYIEELLKMYGALDFFKYITSQTDVYIFSGVIRNFLQGYLENRDFDFVVKTHVSFPESFVNSQNISVNKLGGFKINFNDLTIDMWNIGQTWGLLQRNHRKITPNALISTAFFNFSSIVFDYNRTRFIVSDDYCNFRKNNIIDVVFKDNPYESSCIVSTLYYMDRFDCRIGRELRKWIVQHYDENQDYQTPQIKRFGKIEYDDHIVKSFVKICGNKQFDNCVVVLKNNNKQVIIKF